MSLATRHWHLPGFRSSSTLVFALESNVVLTPSSWFTVVAANPSVARTKRKRAMTMDATFRIVPLIRGLLGAAVGGTVGYFAFDWMYSQGFYAMILPGAALGIGFGAFARERSTVHGVVSAILGVGLGFFVEWCFFPFRKDGSLTYFITHVHELRSVSLMMIALGGVFAYWFGIGRTPVNREDHRAE